MTYESRDDAMDAMREFNGANAKGKQLTPCMIIFINIFLFKANRFI